MKFIVTLLFFFCLNALASAQYDVQSTTGTYQALQNPTSLNLNTHWLPTYAFPLNFNFNVVIDSQSYNSCQVLAGGGLRFLGNETKELYVFHTPTEGYLLEDRGDTTSFSPVSYEIDSSSSSRILKIEWQNAGFLQVGSTANPNDSVSFQIWLYEGTNCIEIHFGPHSASSTSYPNSTGTSFKFLFDNCSNMLGMQGDPNSPTHLFYDACQPNFNYLNGQPNEGLIYIICPWAVPIQKIQTANQVKVYPNPTKSSLTIDPLPTNFELKTLRLYNNLGQIVLVNHPSLSEGACTLTLPNLPQGIYWLQMESTEHRIINKKISIRLN